MIVILTFIVSLFLGAPAADAGAGRQRFDISCAPISSRGSPATRRGWSKGMAACERVLADNPNHAEALVWHGAGLAFSAGRAFQKGDMKPAASCGSAASRRWTKAVALEPDNVGVLHSAGRAAASGDAEHAGRDGTAADREGRQRLRARPRAAGGDFGTLGDHPKGELLFGLAEGYSRLGNGEKARMYFDRLIKDAPASGQAPKAQAWLATGAIPKSAGLRLRRVPQIGMGSVRITGRIKMSVR